MSDPWVIQPQEIRVQYAQCQVIRTEKIGNGGNIWFEMKIFLTPIEAEKPIVERTYRTFNPEFQKIIIPSVMKLVSAGKLTSPADLETEYPFVSYKWTEHKSYDKRDLEYWRERDPDKLSVDNQGRSYKGQFVIEFVDIYSDKTTWRKAAESDKPVEVATESVEENPPNEIIEASLAALVKISGTDMGELATMLSKFVDGKFTVQSPEVKSLVAKMVAINGVLNDKKQAEMLKEINSHFNSETPYLELDSPELMNQLEEIPF